MKCTLHTGFEGSDINRILSLKVLRFLGIKISKYQDVPKCSRCQSFRISRFPKINISRVLGFEVSGFPDFRVSRFLTIKVSKN
jgi:hypothetical protein